MSRALFLLVLSLALCVIVAACAKRASSPGANQFLTDISLKELPAGYSIDRSFVVSQDQTLAIAQKLGASVERISNTHLIVHGQPIQVNILDAKTDADAVKAHQALSALKADAAFCLRRGRRVIEFVGDDPALAKKVSQDLGLTKPGSGPK